jgi:ABC-type antimicrobial peptide transport system permease subunit
VCCAAQLWTTARAPLTQALTGGQKGASAGPQQRRAHAILIALEVAACLTLLVGAALMVQSGLRILAVDMGLQTRDVVVGRLSLSQQKYPDAARRSRFLASLLAVFSLVAAVLALLGIYGVIAYTVRQREREIAIRLAVGADRGMITRLFLQQGAAVLAVGLTMGVGGALLLGRLLQTQLFGVRAADPVAIALVALPFAACGLAAIGWPARAAASVDPAAALKN